MKRRVALIAALVLALVAVLLVGSYATSATAAQPAPTATPAATPENKQGDAKPNVEKRLSVRPIYGWLGIEIESVENGAAVRTVTPDSPAAKAGVAVGDVITAVDGKEVKSAKDLTAHMRGVKPGDNVRLTVKRGSEVREFTLQAGEWPERVVRVPVPGPLAPFGGWLAGIPQLRELEGIRGEEAFSHFLAGEFQLSDKDGRTFTVRLTPGVVTAVDQDKVRVKVNGQAAAEREFRVDDSTLVRPGGARTAGLAVGDKAVVISVGAEDVARAIVKPGAPAIKVPAAPRRGLDIPRDWLDRFFKERPPRAQPGPKATPSAGA